MLIPNGRVVMISGANRGIGLAAAHTLSTAGFHLSLGVRNPDGIDVSSFEGDIEVCRWDATDAQSSTRWAAATRKRFGRIDAIVLNAGIFKAAGLDDDLESNIDEMWNINFKGPLHLVKAILADLKACGNGRVINLVSLSGKRLLSENNLGYSASKFASLALTHAIRQHGWQSGVRATAICPGLVDTDMVAHVDPPEGQFKIAPAAIAATIAYALSLPNDASVAEILVNSRLEPSF